MKRNFFILTTIFICACTLSKAQDSDSIRFYHEAYEVIDSMLTGQAPLSFKKAVFTTENAFLDGQLDFDRVNQQIVVLKKLAEAVVAANPIIYDAADKGQVEKHAAIFKVLTDTIPLMPDSTHVILHTPYTYDFEDMWGQDDWTKMFVSKLLASKKGNCHSMPYLYKILAEEFHIPAYVAFAPNHIYIKLYCQKTGWYNTELTSATFPVDAWVMASGYVSLDAIRNGLYMDTLSTRQSVACCLLDLAQGYRRKFEKENPAFVIKCCDTVLKCHPANVNAMLTKAEAEKQFIETKMKSRNTESPEELFSDRPIREMYDEMEQTYIRLYRLGYRRMPEKMYLEWMEMLKDEPEKYIQKPITLQL